MTTREVWVEVHLHDGETLLGMLRWLDSERVVLRSAHWIWLGIPDPVVEWLPVDRPWQQMVEIDASEVRLVSDYEDDWGQRFNITKWPGREREPNPLWRSRKLEPMTKLYPKRHPSMTDEYVAALRPEEYD